MTSKPQTSRWWRVLAVEAALVAWIIPTSSAIPPRPHYMSRPDLNPPVFNKTEYLSDQVSPGYWFVAPQGNGTQPGPYIFDNKGELVWSGYSPGSPPTTWDFRPSTIKNDAAFTYWQGNVQSGDEGHGQNIILNSSYEPFATVRAGNNMLALDGHEFNVIENGKTALVTIFQHVQRDLSDYNITAHVGWVVEAVFQEIDIATGAVKFEWRSLDHVPLNESMVGSPGLAGAKETAWDYFHINSVDKIPTGPYVGHYLISGRYTSTIYLISPNGGSIIWRLSGQPSSDFALGGFNFAFQHNARFHPNTNTSGPDSNVTMISLFDNASNGITQSRNYSSGMLISLPDLTPLSTRSSAVHNPAPLIPPAAAPKPTATLLTEFKHPQLLSASSQGNLQLPLPNSNILISWGSTGSITEHLPNGSCVLELNFANPSITTYRAYKMALPSPLIPATSSPDLYIFSLSPTSPTAFYASWNGATAVAQWVFYGSNSMDGNTTFHAPFHFLARVDNGGFETPFVTPGHFTWGYVTALDGTGKILGTSQQVKTFTPSATLAKDCTTLYCPLQPLALPQAPPTYLTPPDPANPAHHPDICWHCADGIALGVMFVFTGGVLFSIMLLLPARAWWRRKQIYERRHGKHYRGRRRRRGEKGWKEWVGRVRKDGRKVQKEWEGRVKAGFSSARGFAGGGAEGRGGRIVGAGYMDHYGW